ncbi:MAG TPA: FAD-binding oxidoreductase [Methylocella sp.]|nr:FAD-binding oxidoreductase [Methylocella sp.]
MSFDLESAASREILARLEGISGARHVIADAPGMEGFLREPRGRFHGKAFCVVQPGSTQEIAEVLKLCHETATPVVPQGGNTGLVGGQVPLGPGNQIVLSLGRMTALREIDLGSNTMTVDAGMVLSRVQQAAARVGRLFPLSLAAEGSCTIGGNLATNAGGTNVFAYGNARDLVLGLEAVLADGRIFSDLSKLKKNNTGYDLKNLFIGSEGTLGIITAAVLKLFPRPRAIETAFIGLASPLAALALFDIARDMAGGEITSFELIPRVGLDFVLAHFNAREVLSGKHLWYVLLELSSQSGQGLAARLLALLEAASEKHIVEDAAVAASIDQRENFWKLRELLPDAQSLEGGSIKHDVSVPIADIPAFLEEAARAVMAAIPGARLVPFGHLGDGNIHCNVSQPVGADTQAFLARWDEINAVVHGLVVARKGSIAAEHGIGQLKRNLLPKVKDEVAMEVMRAIKQTLYPKNILNPGKVL